MNNNNRNARTFYTHYKNNKKDKDSSLDFKTYREILYKFNTFLMQKILEGQEVILPSRMGRLCILGTKQNIKVDEDGKIKGLRIDWKSTKELWARDPKMKEEKRLVYFFNEHTEGINYSFKWFKSRVLITNKYYYTFVPSRHNKRLLAKLIKTESAEYLIKD